MAVESLIVKHLSFSSTGGAGASAKRLSHALMSQGIDSSLFTVADGDLWSNPLVAPMTSVAATADYFAVRKRTSPSLVSLHRSYFGARSLDLSDLARTPSSIVHLHWTLGLFSLTQLETLLRRGTPVFWTLHDMWPLTGACHQADGCQRFSNSECTTCPQVRRSHWGLVTKQFARKRKLLESRNLWLIAPSQWIFEQALTHPSITESKIRTIPNVPVHAPPADTRTVFRAPLSESNAGIKLLFVASRIHDPAKGLEDLLRSLKTSSQLRNRIELRIVGKGLPRRCYSWVRYLGPLTSEQLDEEYAGADMLVVPSRAENSPGVIREALDRCLPIAARAVGDIPLMISGNGQNLLLESDDDWGERLSSHLNELNGSEIARRRYSSKRNTNWRNEVIEAHHAYYLEALAALDS